MSDVQTKFPDSSGNDRIAVWRSKNGTLHRAVGADAGLPCERIRLLWTACGKHDVPANAAWLQTIEDEIDCQGCIEVNP